jgi:transposase
MTYLGIDLHSNQFTCCFLEEDKKAVKMIFSLDTMSLNEFYKLLNKNTYVMVEASTNTFKFVELIEKKVKQVFIANTFKLKLISMVKKKTDKVDAEKLAIFLKMQITSKEELIKPVYKPDEKTQVLRALFTSYKQIRKQIVSTKNRIHSLLKQNLMPFTKKYIFGKEGRKTIKALTMSESLKFQLYTFFDLLESSESFCQKIKDRIFLEGACYEKEIELLTSMKGLSVFAAIAIMADIATISRFPNSKHFASYLRSAPGVDSSNERTINLATNKCGRRFSIILISQALNHFRDSNPKICKWYNKVTEYKPKGKARMAICRKVFTEIFQMLKKGEFHYFRDEENHKRKLKKYQVFLEKNKLVLEKEKKVA